MEQKTNQELPQDKLKNQVLSKEILPEDFLEKVRDLDQSTPSRDQAFENLKLLTDSNVREIFEDSDEKASYYAILSLTQFHIGQIYAESNSGDTLTYFEAALTSAKEVDWEGYEQDVFYIEGTVAYLNSDIQKLKEMFLQMKEGRNKIILGNFIQGLKERGVPNYYSDYSK
ncbi:MAG: hypothetical protein RLY57_549 [Candidatus Parcubacteria bacterium]|jgi:hypothetical protein